MQARIKGNNTMNVKLFNSMNSTGTISTLTGKLRFYFNNELHENIMPTQNDVRQTRWSVAKQEFVDINKLDKKTGMPKPITNKELAQKLAKGWKNWYPKYPYADMGIVPPRPMLKQFLSKEGTNIKAGVSKSLQYVMMNKFATSLAKGEEVDPAEMDKWIKDLMNNVGAFVTSHFANFIEEGQVYPSNAKYTVRKKGFNKPGFHTGDLAESLDFEWLPSPPPQSVTARLSV